DRSAYSARLRAARARRDRGAGSSAPSRAPAPRLHVGPRAGPGSLARLRAPAEACARRI
ncbi:MAG: hypothetical protein AVDCRST_MAG68-842, partial [uncultured Gemmatimonadetes bacterium]